MKYLNHLLIALFLAGVLALTHSAVKETAARDALREREAVEKITQEHVRNYHSR